MKFHNPTKGQLSFKQVIKEVLAFMNQKPNKKHRLIIGTDSNARGDIDFVTALVVHCVGYGGRYFWKKTYPEKDEKLPTLRQRIYKEVALSLDLAEKLLKKLPPSDVKENLEIHVDVGKKGETRDIIQEVVGMVRGNGFNCYTKPSSFGASNIADKHV